MVFQQKKSSHGIARGLQQSKKRSNLDFFLYVQIHRLSEFIKSSFLFKNNQSLIIHLKILQTRQSFSNFQNLSNFQNINHKRVELVRIIRNQPQMRTLSFRIKLTIHALYPNR